MLRTVCLTGLVGLAGCVIDSKIDEVDLDLPERRVIVDTADWELTDEGTLPSVACTAKPDLCADHIEMWCGAEEICDAECRQETCEVNVLVALWNTIDLTVEQATLAQLEGRPLQSVTIDEVVFTVSENTLNVDSPALTVSVAPTGVMSVGAGGAQAVGIIPSLTPGSTIEDESVELTASGRMVLANRMRDYQTPFNLVVGATVLLRAGDPVPSGRLVANLRVSAHANTGL
jgi:hypothetical protein